MAENNLREIFFPSKITESLQILNIQGNKLDEVVWPDSQVFKNLKHVSVSKIKRIPNVLEDLSMFGSGIESIRVWHSNIQFIKRNSFTRFFMLKYLDISDHEITNIEPNSFMDVGKSLITLKMSNAFSRSFLNIAPEVFYPLFALEELDLSNNRLKMLSESSFYSLRSLKTIYINDNQIEHIEKGTFQVSHKYLYCKVHTNAFKGF